MNFKIIIFDKLTNKAHKDALAEYQKRLSRYCKIKLVEYKSIEEYKKNSSSQSYIIQMTTEDETMTSEGLSEYINRLGVTGKSDVTIIYTNEVIECDEKYSVSRMNLSDQMFAITIYEQIYRAFRIMRNEPYHK
ncbi:MAG: 23S rRNA (pseudouridine(1915)-N(3))-methyltransferase RlmH [Clostridia bacterium]|nr:23S rRNA (pseudouridine(1915)-N(3))-methyltransferase RlmH [Clostridia bacterium]